MMFHDGSVSPPALAHAREAWASLLRWRAAIGSRQGDALAEAQRELRKAARAFNAIPTPVRRALESEHAALRLARKTEVMNPAGAERLRRWALGLPNLGGSP